MPSRGSRVARDGNKRRTEQKRTVTFAITTRKIPSESFTKISLGGNLYKSARVLARFYVCKKIRLTY